MPRFALIAALVLLAACGQEAPTQPQPTKSAIDSPPEIPVMGPEFRIVALGDSLLTGYGLEEGESYPDKLEAALRARGINARIVNAGVSGDTTAGGLQRLEFTLDAQQEKPDLVLISLGGNDMLRGLPPGETRANLDAMLGKLNARGIDAIMMGMLAAPNLGKDYSDSFNPIYPALAEKHGAALVPFFLAPLMDKPDLIQADRVHPTEGGIEAMVETTVDAVAEALPEREAAS